MIELLNVDCMEYMAGLKDKAFDLAIVDPPYGIGKTWGKSSCPKYHKRKKYANKDWNKSIPEAEYFEQLYRVSEHQIIWGCNYYNPFIIHTGRIIWDKKTAQSITSAADLASQSFSNKIDLYRFMWDGYRQEVPEDRIHPTQKPEALYKWLLNKYAKPNFKILDTHLGSGSIAIACHDLGFDLVGTEIDADYYAAAPKRFENHKLQLKIAI